MAKRTREGVSSQVQSESKELVEASGLPFRELLSSDKVQAALDRAGVKFRDRVYNPMVTLWAFLSQVMAGDKGSCENATSRVLADRVAHGKAECSTDSSSYCEARRRLPTRVVAELARELGQELHEQSPPEWLFHGRPVKIVDGSTVTMADTAENQAAYPQSRNQKPGLGFPILRMVVVLSLSVGTVLDCAIGRCRGKKTGEQNLFRQLWSVFVPGDIALGDRLYDSYRDIALLKKERQVDSIFGMKQSRRSDFRKGRKLGPDDHVVSWTKPKYDPDRFQSREEWESIPETIEMREVRATIRRRGYQTRIVIIVTTLLNPDEFSANDLMRLFAERWHCELDLRAIKQALKMNHLRCKTPEMVEKEIWAHILAYNLIRVRMAQAATVHDKLPRQLSFTAALNHIENFGSQMQNANKELSERLEAAMLKAISKHKVGNRPGRKEPRAIKKRVQKYSYLTKPRARARKGLPA